MTTDIAAYPIEKLATAPPPRCEARIWEGGVDRCEVPCECPAAHRVSYLCGPCGIRLVVALCDRCIPYLPLRVASHPPCGTIITEWTVLS